MDRQGERGKAVAVEIEYDSLDKLRVGLNSIIKVMICQTWDVTNAYGRYRSTEYVVSNAERDTCACHDVGVICADFLKRTCQGNATYIVILPSMNIKEYRGEIYLLSTSANTLFDAINIPQIADFHSIFRANNTSTVHCLAPPPALRSVTIAQLIHMGRQQKETRKQTMAVHCSVHIESIHTKDTWFYYACGNNGCKRKLDRDGPKFVCKTCKKDCDFPQTCYRLHVEAADATGPIVATFFDEVAEALLNKNAATLLC